jgi:dTDP-4-amino-4,6-dideoxygalactose transaminase
VGHLYHLRFQTGEQRSRFIKHMKQQGVACVFHYQPLHVSPVGKQFGGRPGQCPVAEHAGECLVRLPLFNTLTLNEQQRIIDAATSFLP